MSVDVLLETERLILRRFTESDAQHLFALDNDPDVMRFINSGTPTPRDIIQKDILPVFLRYDDGYPAYGFWAAVEESTGEFMGWISLRPANGRASEAVLGYRLCKAAWGRGYATEGARALVGKGFTEMDVQRVVATTYEYNRASIRVMEKLGMTLVRRFRLTPEALANVDTFHTDSLEVWDGDDVEYALDRETWERQKYERSTEAV